MANKKNLVSLSERTTREQREIAKKGGKKSGQVRREKKLLKELLEEALREKTQTGDRYVDITASLIKEAEKGNVKAYEVIRDTLGQKPIEEHIVSGEINNPLSEFTTEELRKMLNE